MQNFELQITADIRPVGGESGYGNLRVHENITLTAEGFLDLCKILARFHELAEELRGKKK